jgi:hypothetical protein
MANDDTKAPFSRRDTLRLATAVSALGIGLGVSLESKDAASQVLKGSPLPVGGLTTIKLDSSNLGPVSLKLYKLNGDGQNFDLLHALDLSSLFIKGEGAKENVVAIKLFNQKGDQAILISGHEFRIVQKKI